ncbi:MAG: squalene/phytoene synthase family protein [Planctomycetota bacterium]
MNESDALARCAEITRREARNFYYGLRLLPKGKRAALYAVYAWMRVIDDIADADGVDDNERSAGLARVEARTREVIARKTVDEGVDDIARGVDDIALGAGDGEQREHAVFQGLCAVLRDYPVHGVEFLAAIEGQRMDLAPRAYADYEQTELYCDRVAATVGRICLDVWGVKADVDVDIARALSTKRGVAFQLTNILRDIREDHARGRCYLPADELVANGITVDDLLAWSDANNADARCARFMHIQCARAQRIFAESAALDAMVSPAAVATIGAMSAIYREILRKIAVDPRRALAQRVRLSALEKSWIALRARLGLLGARA